MSETCPTCHQSIRKAKPRLAVSTPEPSTLTDSELFAHYKKTDRIETLRFWLRHAMMSDELRQAFQAFTFAMQHMTIKPASFDQSFNALRAMWRRESNARERQQHIEAGDVLISEHWMESDPDVPGRLRQVCQYTAPEESAPIAETEVA